MRSESRWRSIKDRRDRGEDVRITCCRVLVLGFADMRIRAGYVAGRPGKEQTLRLCGTCHEAAKATSVKLTREGWIETIDRMKAFGAAGADEDFAAVLEYLAAHFKGDTVRPLDMNTAEAIDLESVLQLLRRESRPCSNTAASAANSRRSTTSKGSTLPSQENRSEKGSHRLPDTTTKMIKHHPSCPSALLSRRFRSCIGFRDLCLADLGSVLR